MPLPLAHGLLGASLVAAIHPQPTKRHFMPLFVGAILANAADFDFGLVFILHSKAWHRGFSHSIFLALITCLIFVLLLGRRHVTEAVAYGFAFASHGILDYVTTKEGGLELLWPFLSERVGFGWVGLSELPSRMSLVEIIKSMALEFTLFAPILLLVIGVSKYVGRDARAAEGAI